MGVTEGTYYPWRAKYGWFKSDMV